VVERVFTCGVIVTVTGGVKRRKKVSALSKHRNNTRMRRQCSTDGGAFDVVRCFSVCGSWLSTMGTSGSSWGISVVVKRIPPPSTG